MTNIKKTARRLSRCQNGVTLVEVMVAAFILLIAFAGLTQIYTRGRTQIDLEENRRKATSVAQARIEAIRRTHDYDDLINLDDRITSFVVDGQTFQISHNVTVDSPETHSTEIQITVSWTASLQGGDVSRSMSCSTIFGRSLACPS